MSALIAVMPWRCDVMSVCPLAASAFKHRPKVMGAVEEANARNMLRRRAEELMAAGERLANRMIVRDGCGRCGGAMLSSCACDDVIAGVQEREARILREAASRRGRVRAHSNIWARCHAVVLLCCGDVQADRREINQYRVLVETLETDLENYEMCRAENFRWALLYAD